MAGNRRKTLALALGVVGAVLLVCVVFLLAWNWRANARAQGESAAVLAELMAQTPATHAPARGVDAPAVTPAIEIDGHEYMGYVTVESAGIELPVAYEYSDELLDVVPCRLNGDLATRDLVVCGRRHESQFGPLEQVSIGDSVTLVQVDGTVREYVVSNLETVDVDDADYMFSNRNNSDSPADWELTLFTDLLGGQSCLAVRCESA